MIKKFIAVIAAVVLTFFCANAQNGAKLYDEQIDPMTQIDKAVKTARSSGKFVICQVGGNWCPWCIKFADFITKDAEIAAVVKKNYEYIHVNYPRRGAKPELMKRLGNAGRFGFPVMVVLDGNGNVIHIQDSSYLEKDSSYDKAKVMSFFTNWTPEVVSK